MKSSEYRAISNPLHAMAIRIGIDPGVTTGVAIYGHEADEWTLITTDFWGAYHRIHKFDPKYTGVVIEVPNENRRVMYDRVDSYSGVGRVRELMASKIGSNRREAVLLADGLEQLGFTVVRVRPSTAKWDAAKLKRETGITVRTNEHVRDAVRVVNPYV